MTVSIPKPNWRSLQNARERTATALAGRLNAFKSRRGPGDAATAQEWSSVMTAPSRPATAKDRRIAAANTANTAIDQPNEPRQRRSSEVNTAWVLPGLVLVLCLACVGWFFSSGTAAAAWLIALIALGFIGAPVTLLALRLMGFEDRD